MKEYINIAGKKHRIEFNWNALALYCEKIGINDLSAIDNIAHITPADMLIFIWCAIKEGERMDSREFEMSYLDLGAVLRTADIAEAMKIYAKQTKIDAEPVNINDSDPSAAKKKRRLPWIRLRE